MGYIQKIKENNLRYLILIISFFCLLLIAISFENNMFSRRMTTDDCLWIPVDSSEGVTKLLVTDIIPDGVADKAGLKDGDLLIAINDIKFTRGIDPMEILNRHKNETVEYTVIRGGYILKVNIWVYKFVNISFIIFWTVGLSFLIVGIIVGYSRPRELTSRLFFFFSCAASIGLLLFSGINPTGSFNPQNLSVIQRIFVISVNIIYFIALLLMPPLYVHFFMTYPKHYALRRRKLIIALLYSMVFVPAIAIMLFKGVFNNPILPYYARYFHVIYYAAGIIFFRRAYKTITDTSLRKSLSIINRGFLIGGLGITYYLFFVTFNKTPFFLLNPLYLVPNILILAIPVSFGYSIMKYRILDTGFLIKRSIVFGIVTVSIIIIYLILVFLINSYFKEVFKGSNQLFIITFIIIFTFSFDYVNKKAKNFVDRQFFRESYNYRKSLLNFTNEISIINNIDDLIKKIRVFLKDTVEIEIFDLRILNDTYLKALNLSRDGNFDRVLSRIAFNSREPVQINSIDIQQTGITETEYEQIKEKGIDLIIPVFLKSMLLGTLNFGKKVSGKAFSEEDIDLLESFASQSAICLENSRLNVEELAKKSYEEEVNIARKIQFSLLPDDNIKSDKILISGYSEPAKEIGGDFYDIIKLSDDKFMIAIADVSDKGIPAALYMSQVQAMLHFASKIFPSPRDILTEINKQIYDQFNRFSFVTILIAVFDLREKKVTTARAGHTPLLRVRNGIIDSIFPKGIGAGLDKEKIFDENLEETETDTENGDLYFLFSDGLSEAMNNERELYGIERLRSILIQSNNKKIEDIKKEILDDVNSFRDNAPINDDITFTLIRCL
ncbi:MAG: SpoIIE family protein phosphatase [Ignavibacteria bacterium]|jgi:serine phosphatase RsbU (regulator of sigma subunit)|nr:SpoIIE family protein phosphatase [Ignavibacteria bacterium]